MQDHSFKDYVADHLYNELFMALSGFLEENRGNLHVISQHVAAIDEANLSDIEIKGVYIDNKPDMKIAFDVLVEAQLEISEYDRHSDRDDDAYPWFKISCAGDLSHNLDDFSTTAIEEYTCKDKQQHPMSDSLVPIIRKDQLEKVATDFLQRHYPEALDAPMSLGPVDLAERMGLSVNLKTITSDFSVFGQICFADCDTEYYDEDTDSIKSLHVNKGTILVDPNAFFLRNLGAVNNTVIHECVHWDLHRKAFELERLYNKELTHIRCQVVGGIKSDSIRTATDWMEWQANSLAPRIQMPFAPFKLKADALIKEYQKELHTHELIDVMEPVIDALATFFCVSRCAAKIRMVDVGYEEAMGVFIHIDGHYVKPHAFKKGSLAKNQTFSISMRDALFESSVNQTLRATLEQGTYLFVDSHFCINSTQYIENDENGQPALTTYARHHIDECCLIFDLSVHHSTNAYGKQFYTECVLFRDASSDIIFEATYVPSKHNLTIEAHAKLIKACNAEIHKVLSSLPHDFPDALAAIMKWRDITVEKLAEEAWLDAKTITRLRNNPDYTVKKETLVAVCIGLHIPPPLSSELFEKAGIRLNSTELDLTYRFLLNYCWQDTLEDCNVYLAEQNKKPLGRKE